MQTSTLQLFKALISNEKNALFSPYCLEILYTIVAEGTKDDVHKELLEHLECPPDQDIFADLVQKINSLKEIEPTSQIEQTNAIYHIDVIHPVEKYYKKIQEKLTLDLKPIPKEENAHFIIESVLNIKAKWKQSFEQIRNVHEPFFLANGKIVETYFIEQDKITGGSNTKYLKEDNFHAIQIPMKDERLCVEIYLPYQKDGLNNFIENLTKEKLMDWNNQFQSQYRMHVFLPKFELEVKYESLQKEMKAIGIKNLFEESWDFSPMLECIEKLFIYKVTQENKFRLDEIGIEAGSVTRFFGGIAGIPTPDKFVLFEANHPFMYLVRDHKTNTILFIGVFEEPDQSIDFTLYHNNLKEVKKYNANAPQLSFRVDFAFAAYTISTILEQTDYQNDFLDWYVNLLKELASTPLGEEFNKLRNTLENIHWWSFETQTDIEYIPNTLLESMKEMTQYAHAQLLPIIASIEKQFRNNENFVDGFLIEHVRNQLLPRCSYDLVDLNFPLPDVESFTHFKRLKNDPWGEPIHKINFIFKPLPEHCELDEQEERTRANYRKIRRLKPFLFDITVRGAVYFQMKVLNQLMKAEKNSHPLIEKLIDHTVGFILGKNILNHFKLDVIEFSNEATQKINENCFFKSKGESESFTKQFPHFSKILSNVKQMAWDVRNKEKGEHYFDSHYHCSKDTLGKMIEEGLTLPDASFFKAHAMKGEDYLGKTFEMNSKFKSDLGKFLS